MRFKRETLQKTTVSNCILLLVLVTDIPRPDHFTEDKRREFDDPKNYAKFRHKLEDEPNVCLAELQPNFNFYVL